MAAWRYQPVWRDTPIERVYSICEIYIDENDRLEAWTESPEIWPGGNSKEEALLDIMRMYVDCARWEAVPFESLRVGMVFDKLISREEAEGMAEMFEQIPIRERTRSTA